MGMLLWWGEWWRWGGQQPIVMMVWDGVGWRDCGTIDLLKNHERQNRELIGARPKHQDIIVHRVLSSTLLRPHSVASTMMCVECAA